MHISIVSEDRLFREGLSEAIARRLEPDDAVVASRDRDAIASATRIDLLVRDVGRGALHESMSPEIGPGSIVGATVWIGDHRELAGMLPQLSRPATLISREASLAEMVDLILAALDGTTTCCARVTRQVYADLRRCGRQRRLHDESDVYRLSAREVEVLQRMAEGLDNRQIAEALSISVHTVKNHVHSILDKLDVCRREQAVSLAYERNWLPDRRRVAR